MEAIQEWFYSLTPDLTSTQKYSAGACAVVAGLLLWHHGTKRQQNLERQKKIKNKRDECAAAFDTLRKSLTVTDLSSDDEAIVNLTLKDLVARLQNEELKPVQVLRSYQKKALKVNDSLNCVQQPISEAEVWAQALSQRSEKGPLYGVPVSIKDHVPVKGYDTTCGGCTGTFGQPSPEDAVIVKVLKRQGAIPFVLTNVPQTLFCVTCVNPVFGRTKNPHDPDRTPGGSSGGEAALIATQGSLLGIGTDIGGSIRIPSAFCGICGLKPTVGRLSTKGFSPYYTGQTAVEATLGPMAQDVESLALAMKALLIPYQWELDPTIVPLHFQDQIYEDRKPLRIGFLKDNGMYPVTPACERAVDVAVSALKKAGHTVVPYELPDLKTLRFIIDMAYLGDGGKSFLQLLNGDEPIYSLRAVKSIISIPRPLRRVWLGFLKLIMGKADRECMDLETFMGFGTVYEWWELVATAKTYRGQVIDDWRRLDMDALICPVTPCVALPEKVLDDSGWVTRYVAMFNVLNFPVGVVPVTKVTNEDQKRMSQYPAKGRMQKALKEGMSIGGVGLPVAVQCVGLPFHEELVLRVQKDIQTTIKAYHI